jgi:drug/metabolite transporter (DMT)-like permease
LGTAGVALTGILVFGDAVTWPRIAGTALVIIGVVVLNVVWHLSMADVERQWLQVLDVLQ